jgi:Rrf2 family transcriptional regulator, nitric oxide-sensitive transcriptional repressor
MQLTKATDYALHILIYVSQRADRRIKVADVARVHQLSPSHLMKVANRLVHHGYITSIRGRGGGIELARPANRISVGAVVRDLEPPVAVEFQVGDYEGACRLRPRCALTLAFREAQERFLLALDRYNVGDISRSVGPRPIDLSSSMDGR